MSRDYREGAPAVGGHAAMTHIGKHLQYASQIWKQIWRALRILPARAALHARPRPEKSRQSIERKSQIVDKVCLECPLLALDGQFKSPDGSPSSEARHKQEASQEGDAWAQLYRG